MLINFIPTEENHTIDLPKEWYGKEVTIEIKETSEVPKVVLLGDVLPKNLKKYNFLKDVPFDPNFPSLKEIRKNDKNVSEHNIERVLGTHNFSEKAPIKI